MELAPAVPVHLAFETRTGAELADAEVYTLTRAPSRLTGSARTPVTSEAITTLRTVTPVICSLCVISRGTLPQWRVPGVTGLLLCAWQDPDNHEVVHASTGLQGSKFEIGWMSGSSTFQLIVAGKVCNARA
jgi:hypothetical protein